LAEWQTYSFVNCNTLHELDMILGTTRALDDSSLGVAGHSYSNNNSIPPVQLDLLGQGWFRSAWKVETTYDDALVLKTLRLEREFLEEYYDLHRRDAVAMERLTHSPFVMNVYGYCGQSALNELANFKNPDVTSLEALTKRLRGKQGEAVDFLKLKLAMSIATGLAHVHEVNHNRPREPSQEGDEVTVGGGDVVVETIVARHPRDYLPAMVHYDLNPRNIAIVEGGKPKLNDFNIAEFLKYNPKTNTTCGFNSRLHEPWWRAPEEMNTNHTHIGMSLVNEKVDVYALGNILHHILTTHSPRGKMKKERMEEVRAVVRQGIPPLLPDADRQRAKKDATYKAFVQAMELCFVVDPEQRGTARQVADLLYERVRTIQDKEFEPQPKQSQDHHKKKPHHNHQNRHGKH
jgi:serine/threonine protein kinase